MRDIRADLQDRARQVEREISAESARFENLVCQLKAEQESRLAHLRAQLLLANKLLAFAAWEQQTRATLSARIAAAEVAERSIRSIRTSLERSAEPAASS